MRSWLLALLVLGLAYSVLGQDDTNAEADGEAAPETNDDGADGDSETEGAADESDDAAGEDDGNDENTNTEPTGDDENGDDDGGDDDGDDDAEDNGEPEASTASGKGAATGLFILSASIVSFIL